MRLHPVLIVYPSDHPGHLLHICGYRPAGSMFLLPWLPLQRSQARQAFRCRARNSHRALCSSISQRQRHQRSSSRTLSLFFRRALRKRRRPHVTRKPHASHPQSAETSLCQALHHAETAFQPHLHCSGRCSRNRWILPQPLIQQQRNRRTAKR